MKSVSRFDANLLQILQCVFGKAPLGPTLPLVMRGITRPPCLKRETVNLVMDYINKGVVGRLAAEGGWREERFLRNEEIVSGRLWQRDSLETLQLTFSLNSLDFLMTLTSTNLIDHKWNWSPFDDLPFTLGDELLFYYVFEAFEATELAVLWRSAPVFRDHGLSWLMFPQRFALSMQTDEEETETPQSVPFLEPRFDPWMTSTGYAVLEVMQESLSHRWIEVEQSKGGITASARMLALGNSQCVVLNAYLDAIDNSNRRDLARFIFPAAQTLLNQHPTAETWTRILNVSNLRLAERSEVYQAAMTFLQRFADLQQWQDHATHVGYWDEGYQGAQLWKSDWEHFGCDQLVEIANGILRQVEPMAGV